MLTFTLNSAFMGKHYSLMDDKYSLFLWNTFTATI